MTSTISLFALESRGWSLRLVGHTVKSKPPMGVSSDEVADLRQHRNRVRSLLLIRSGALVLGDLEHDAACIADRNGSDMRTARDGAALSAGFTGWADAQASIDEVLHD